MFTLEQLLAIESHDLTILAPATEKQFEISDQIGAPKLFSSKLVEVAVIEGKCEDEYEFAFDGRKVDPLCVNASNPDHYYPGAEMQKNGVKKENGVEDVGDKKIDPKCPNASNPYHVCANYCFDRVQENDNRTGRRQDALSPRGNGKLTIAERKDVDPNCVNASNPYHKCAEYCVEKKQEEVSSLTKSKGTLEVERKDVNPNCVNASNPYHKCAEYCFEKKEEMGDQQGRKSDSSFPNCEGKMNMVERKDVDPNCVNATNPYHKCAEYCIKKKQEIDYQQGTKSDSSSPKKKGKSVVMERNDIDPKCVNASNPYHKCAEYCFEKKQEMHNHQRSKSDSSLPKNKEKSIMVEREDVDPNCVNASNPYHKCAEYCLDKKHMDGQQARKLDSSSPKNKGNLVMVKRENVDPNCVNASNPYHKCAEYCHERKQETYSQQGRKSFSSSPESREQLANLERKDVDPNCVNASNPYHKCAEYCRKINQETNSQRPTSSHKSKGKLVTAEREDVDPDCVNSSNPYHKCTEHCLGRNQETVSSLSKGKGKLVVDRKDVDRNCVNASNPYHRCGEHCSQRMMAAAN